RPPGRGPEVARGRGSVPLGRATRRLPSPTPRSPPPDAQMRGCVDLSPLYPLDPLATPTSLLSPLLTGCFRFTKTPTPLPKTGLVQMRVTLGGVKPGASLATRPCLVTIYGRNNAAVHREKCYPGSERLEPGPKTGRISRLKPRRRSVLRIPEF